MDEIFGIKALADRTRQQGDTEFRFDRCGLEVPMAALTDNLRVDHDLLIEGFNKGMKRKGWRIKDEGFVFDFVKCDLGFMGQRMIRPQYDFQIFFIKDIEIVGHFCRNRQGDKPSLDDAFINGGNDVV